jgi:predicted alpha/beta superfamily hydrolase
MRFKALLLPILFAAPMLWAGTPITVGERISLPSRILKEERTLLVSLPANYGRSTERYPVLYLTDGDAHLTHTRGTVDFLAANGLMPNLIIVGITNTDRTRDLSPTRAGFRRADGTIQDLPTSGGAPRFLEFFERELFPFVESKYRTAPYRIFAGHSLGGLLAIHAFAARPDLFNACISAAPSLEWDADYPLRRLEEFLKGGPRLQRTLFVSMANDEDGQPRPNRFDRLQAILKGHPVDGLRWEATAMPEEDHGSVVLRSQYWGFKRVFEGWRLDGSKPATLPEIQAHYAQLSRRMGVPIEPPEGAVNLAGYRLLGAGRREEALAVFRHNVARFPASANVHDSLGEALEGAGRLEEARESYGRAVELAQKTGDPLMGIFARNRDRAAGLYGNTK